MKVSTVVAAAFLVSAGMALPVHAQDKDKAKAAPKKASGGVGLFYCFAGK